MHELFFVVCGYYQGSLVPFNYFPHLHMHCSKEVISWLLHWVLKEPTSELLQNAWSVFTDWIIPFVHRMGMNASVICCIRADWTFLVMLSFEHTMYPVIQHVFRKNCLQSWYPYTTPKMITDFQAKPNVLVNVHCLLSPFIIIINHVA